MEEEGVEMGEGGMEAGGGGGGPKRGCADEKPDLWVELLEPGWSCMRVVEVVAVAAVVVVVMVGVVGGGVVNHIPHLFRCPEIPCFKSNNTRLFMKHRPRFRDNPYKLTSCMNTHLQ